LKISALKGDRLRDLHVHRDLIVQIFYQFTTRAYLIKTYLIHLVILFFITFFILKNYDEK